MCEWDCRLVFCKVYCKHHSSIYWCAKICLFTGVANSTFKMATGIFSENAPINCNGVQCLGVFNCIWYRTRVRRMKTTCVKHHIIMIHVIHLISYTGKRQTFSDGLSQGHIKLLTSEDNTRCLLTTIKKFSVQHVIHPVTMEKIDYNVAVLEGKTMLAKIIILELQL